VLDHQNYFWDFIKVFIKVDRLNIHVRLYLHNANVNANANSKATCTSRMPQISQPSKHTYPVTLLLDPDPFHVGKIFIYANLKAH